MALNPTVKTKRKNITALFDYCLESKIEITVKPNLSIDEFEVEFNISDIKKAILLGMFLRENRLELNGVQNSATTTTASRTTKKAETKDATASREETVAPMNFEEEGSFQLDLEAAN